MTTKRFLAFFLAAIMLAGSLTGLVSCNPAGENETTTTDGGTQIPEENQNKEIVLFDGGEWKFDVVRARKLTSIEETSSMRFRSEIGALVSGDKIDFTNDSLAEGESYDSETLQIYFGNTAHPEMKEFFPTVGLGEAAIKVVGNKILIASNSYEGYARATAAFESLCSEKLKDGKIVVTAEELNQTIVVSKFINEVPAPEGLSVESYDECEYNQTLLIFKDATPEIFNTYKTKFEGFTVVQDTEKEGNYFTTFEKDSSLYNISYSKGDKKLRLIVNQNTKATEFMTKPATVDTKTTPMVILHGLMGINDDQQNGLCLLIRLSDGRFIVVDGGFNRNDHSNELYTLIRKNTPTGMKPTIAAWIITHAHGDHNGTFTGKFVSQFSNTVDIESVIFNPPSDAINQSKSDSGTKEGGAYKTIVTLTQGIEGCEWIRAHVGDKYYIGDAELDVLYSVDQYYPATFTYYNTCSLIISLKIAGQTIIITGDAANASFSKAVKMFETSFKADIVQVAHHGYTSGVDHDAATSLMQAYRLMSPSLVLWPIGPNGYNSVKNSVHNRTLVTLPSVKEIIVAEDEDHYINLPYTPPSN